MDMYLAVLLCFGLFTGCNAQQTGSSYFACRDGEEYQMCQSPCEPSCSTINERFPVNCSRPCVPGCFCRPGLVRANDRTCVRPTDCTRPACRENEEFSECGSSCALNCTNMYENIFCTLPCRSGCFCKPGFVRDSSGNCINPERCYRRDDRCPSNEEYVDCINLCNTCLGSVYCTKPRECRPGCDCRRRFLRNSYGQCVPPEQCIYDYWQLCGENEEFKECVNPCNDCEYKGRCPYPLQYCEPGCDCKRGYRRNERGVCVEERYCYGEQCPKNEQFYQCIPNCRNTCQTFNVTDIVCDLSCRKGCSCKQGYVKREDGVCVRPQDCPVVCGLNEVYKTCGRLCEPGCDNTSSTLPCSNKCARGCFCRNGYVRDPDGNCILPEQCPRRQQCGRNEVFQNCGTACPKTCDNLNITTTCIPQCVPGCFCRSGFVRSLNGTCIPPRLCPYTPVCGQNEVFKNCGKICEPGCDNSSLPSSCPSRCARGCFCRDGFVRDPDGNCILLSQCPITSCRANETFYHCIPPCGTTCEALISDNTQPCPRRCRAGCFCLPGFVRRDDGRCVRPEDCPAPPRPTCPPGQIFYNCVPTCRNTCDNFNFTSPCPNVCRPGCFCRRGFVREANGQCVRPQSCPVACGVNEEFRPCGAPCQLSCATIDERRSCPLPCVRGCFCKTGFIRGPRDICIRPSECPFANSFEGRKAGNENSTDTETTMKTTEDPQTTVKRTPAAERVTTQTSAPPKDSTSKGTSVNENLPSATLKDSASITEKVPPTTVRPTSPKISASPPDSTKTPVNPPDVTTSVMGLTEQKSEPTEEESEPTEEAATTAQSKSSTNVSGTLS